MIIIILIIIIVVLAFMKLDSYLNKPMVEGLSTFNGKLAVDDQYFYDKLFDDVIYYQNEYKKDNKLDDVVLTGWEKCKTECPASGKCVEYGITGHAYCFNY